MSHIPDVDDPVHTGWPVGGPFVAVVDPWARELAELADYLAAAEAVYELEGRPTVEAADAIDRLALAAGVLRIVSVGAGLVIDAVKLTAFRRRERSGELIGHAAIPCGPEPYR